VGIRAAQPGSKVLQMIGKYVEMPNVSYGQPLAVSLLLGFKQICQIEINLNFNFNLINIYYALF